MDRQESVEKDIEVLQQRIQQKLQPYTAQVALDEIPGVDWTLAAVIIAELGVNRNLVHRLQRLGYAVTLAPQDKAA